jgi:hypothetical protein
MKSTKHGHGPHRLRRRRACQQFRHARAVSRAALSARRRARWPRHVHPGSLRERCTGSSLTRIGPAPPSHRPVVTNCSASPAPCLSTSWLEAALNNPTSSSSVNPASGVAVAGLPALTRAASLLTALCRVLHHSVSSGSSSGQYHKVGAVV